MPNCKNVDYSIKHETGKREGFVLLALLTQWHLHCLKKIQSEEHSEFSKQQERILFNKIKDQVKKFKNKLISFDVKDLKDIGVACLIVKLWKILILKSF